MTTVSSVDIESQVELISEIILLYVTGVYLAAFTLSLGVSLAVAVPVILVLIVVVVFLRR